MLIGDEQEGRVISFKFKAPRARRKKIDDKVMQNMTIKKWKIICLPPYIATCKIGYMYLNLK
ncbi:hypothetical protein HYC85_003621 [Camellia sinensis]|uniref:Uncharacterized protein n=1 Tax=Camellia sinensis TaxID=4442 RepID=A0A7J7HWC3_CAMSI|nr:hypothetical protein HYC85_003621 [Camellia sinensis]